MRASDMVVLLTHKGQRTEKPLNKDKLCSDAVNLTLRYLSLVHPFRTYTCDHENNTGSLAIEEASLVLPSPFPSNMKGQMGQLPTEAFHCIMHLWCAHGESSKKFFKIACSKVLLRWR